MSRKSSPEFAKAFVEKALAAGLSKIEIDRLMGGSGASEGKNCRRWEMYGAPAETTILMAYINRYGWGVAKKVAKQPA